MTQRAMRPGWVECDYPKQRRSSRIPDALGFLVDLKAEAGGNGWRWRVTDQEGAEYSGGIAESEPAAQLAAENALRNVLTAALDELGPAP